MPDRGLVARVVGFAAGFGIAWVGYGVRAGLLPDTVGGRAVTVVLVLALCTVVAATTLGRLPLWTTLVGVAAMVGSYEEAYAAAPSQFLDTSLSAATTVLLAAALGFVTSALLGETLARSRTDDTRGGAHVETRTDERVVA